MTKEFWLYDNGEVPFCAFNKEHIMDETLPLNQLIHVVEYKAYEKAISALKKLHWRDRPNDVPQTFQDRIAEQVLKELNEL